jgi:thiol-disulfide isomerase/thioredoxin
MSRCLLPAALLLLFAAPARSQTADEIADRYVAATGGAQKWAALQSLTISSRSPYFSSDAWWKRPDRIRIDAWSDMADHTDARAFDGTSGWRLNSLEGSARPRGMSAAEIAELREEGDWMFELVDYKAKGHKIKLVGTAPVDGQPAYRLQLTRASGTAVDIYLSQKTGLEVLRTKWARSPDGQDVEIVMPVGDYRETGGLLLPQRVGQASRAYVVNGPIADTIFQRPGGISEREMAAKKVSDAVAQLLPAGSRAPEWELRDPQGRIHRSADYRGRVLVIDFWATWCVPCHRMMPELQRLHDDFSRRGLIVVGISTSERGGDPAMLMKDRGYTYTLLLNGETIANRFHVAGMPTVYVIGRDGRVLHAAVGADAARNLSRILPAALHQ